MSNLSHRLSIGTQSLNSAITQFANAVDVAACKCEWNELNSLVAVAVQFNTLLSRTTPAVREETLAKLVKTTRVELFLDRMLRFTNPRLANSVDDSDIGLSSASVQTLHNLILEVKTVSSLLKQRTEQQYVSLVQSINAVISSINSGLKGVDSGMIVHLNKAIAELSTEESDNLQGFFSKPGMEEGMLTLLSIVNMVDCNLRDSKLPIYGNKAELAPFIEFLLPTLYSSLNSFMKGNCHMVENLSAALDQLDETHTEQISHWMKDNFSQEELLLRHQELKMMGLTIEDNVNEQSRNPYRSFLAVLDSAIVPHEANGITYNAPRYDNVRTAKDDSHLGSSFHTITYSTFYSGDNSDSSKL